MVGVAAFLLFWGMPFDVSMAIVGAYTGILSGIAVAASYGCAGSENRALGWTELSQTVYALAAGPVCWLMFSLEHGEFELGTMAIVCGAVLTLPMLGACRLKVSNDRVGA